METFKPSIRAIITTIFKKWNIKISINDVYDIYNESHRFYHTSENHITPMLDNIVKFNDDMKLDDNIFEILIITAIFHDIVYNPKSKTNEEDSAKFLLSMVSDATEGINTVVDTILMTKTHNFTNKIEELFCMFDLDILTKDLPELIKWEDLINKEFEWVNWKDYKRERIEVIKKFLEKRTELPIEVNHTGLQNLIYIIENKQPNIAIYAGSFAPFHLGHMNIVKKSDRLFDKVIIAKGRNDSKEINEVTFENEFKKLHNLFPTKEVITYKGLLTNLLKEQEGKITLIRGLRNGYDLEAENTMMVYMKDLYPELKIVYIPCDKEYEHISSSAIRSLEKYGDDVVKKYLP